LVISFSNKFGCGVPVKKNLDNSAKYQFVNCLPRMRESLGPGYGRFLTKKKRVLLAI